MTGELRDALLDTDEKRFAHMHNTEFHNLIETLCMTMPGMIEATARLGIATDVDLKRKVEDATRTPPRRYWGT